MALYDATSQQPNRQFSRIAFVRSSLIETLSQKRRMSDHAYGGINLSYDHPYYRIIDYSINIGPNKRIVKSKDMGSPTHYTN